MEPSIAALHTAMGSVYRSPCSASPNVLTRHVNLASGRAMQSVCAISQLNKMRCDSGGGIHKLIVIACKQNTLVRD